MLQLQPRLPFHVIPTAIL
uniref:Uncharacterized protein n=1 Tax=Arundo donax TaxID=35708 RepID=A0A0A8ZHH6_ARUDO